MRDRLEAGNCLLGVVDFEERQWGMEWSSNMTVLNWVIVCEAKPGWWWCCLWGLRWRFLQQKGQERGGEAENWSDLKNWFTPLAHFFPPQAGSWAYHDLRCFSDPSRLGPCCSFAADPPSSSSCCTFFTPWLLSLAPCAHLSAPTYFLTWGLALFLLE